MGLGRALPLLPLRFLLTMAWEPDVNPAPPLQEMRMELSNAEVATLQEAAVPQQTIRRLQAMMEALDRHQAEDRGPEARWALGCLLRRLDEGLQALDAALGVMARRLVPRGYLPVRRYPVDEGTRWHIYSWARAYRDDLSHILDRHLQTGLIPDDAVFPDSGRPIQAPSSPSVVASEAQASTPREAVSITDDAASPDIDSSDESGEEKETQPSLNSSWARNDTGQLVHVEPASPSDLPRGPPPAVPVNAPVTTADEGTGSSQAVSESPGEPTQIERALRGELLGIWREPVTVEIGKHFVIKLVKCYRRGGYDRWSGGYDGWSGGTIDPREPGGDAWGWCGACRP